MEKHRVGSATNMVVKRKIDIDRKRKNYLYTQRDRERERDYLHGELEALNKEADTERIG